MRSTLSLFVFALAASAPALAIEQVPVPSFRAIELRGGGTVTIAPSPVQRVTLVEGSTQFTRVRVDRDGKLVIDACNERCPHTYHLRITIETPNLSALAVDGGGIVSTANGFAPQNEVALAVNGGGKIDARSFEAATVAAAVDGGGVILAGPSSTLAASVNGGGEIVYSGRPTVATSIDGGGTVRPGG
jgi:hypothetical protein